MVRTCNRALERDEDDGWVKPTLLGAAFRAGEPREVQRLIKEVAREGHAAWKLETTLNDIRGVLETVGDDALRAQLTKALERLERLKA